MPPQLVVNTEKDFYFLDPKNKTKQKQKKQKYANRRTVDWLICKSVGKEYFIFQSLLGV